MGIYLLTFCRVVIGLTFVVSSGSKVLNISKFRLAVLSFHLLPSRLSGIAAIVFLWNIHYLKSTAHRYRISSRPSSILRSKTFQSPAFLHDYEQ